MVRGGPVAFRFFLMPPAASRSAACWSLKAEVAAFGAQPAHHRRFLPSAGSQKVGTFTRQPSHFFHMRTAPACPFAQPAHHRAFPSAGSP